VLFSLLISLFCSFQQLLLPLHGTRTHVSRLPPAPATGAGLHTPGASRRAPAALGVTHRWLLSAPATATGCLGVPASQQLPLPRVRLWLPKTSDWRQGKPELGRALGSPPGWPAPRPRLWSCFPEACGRQRARAELGGCRAPREASSLRAQQPALEQPLGCSCVARHRNLQFRCLGRCPVLRGVSLDVSSSPPTPPGTPRPSLARPGEGRTAQHRWQHCAQTPVPPENEAVGQLKEAEAPTSGKSAEAARPVRGLPLAG